MLEENDDKQLLVILAESLKEHKYALLYVKWKITITTCSCEAERRRNETNAGILVILTP